MPMQIVETIVSSQEIRMILADQPAEPAERIELWVPVAVLKNPKNALNPLGNVQDQFVGEVQAAALIHVRRAIDAEIQRLREAM